MDHQERAQQNLQLNQTQRVSPGINVGQVLSSQSDLISISCCKLLPHSSGSQQLNSDSHWVTHLFPFPAPLEAPAWPWSALWLAAGEAARLQWQEFTQGHAKPRAHTPAPPLCTLISEVYAVLAYEDLLFLHSLQDKTQVSTIRLL